MYGTISDPGMGHYSSRVALAPRTPANQQSSICVGGFHTVRGGIDQGSHRFHPRLLEFNMYGNMEIFLTQGWDSILPGWRWLH